MSESVRGIYLDVLGREPDAAGWNSYTDALNSGALSYWDIRSQIAHSGEAANDIQNVYQGVFGRGAADWEINTVEGWLANGMAIGQLRVSYSQSGEAAAAIQGVYQSVLGRTASDGEVNTVEGWLGNGMSIAQLRWSAAHWSEATSALDAIYHQVLGRGVDQIGITNYEDSALGVGWSLSDVRWHVAHSNEAAADIDSMYWQVLGRPADSIGLVGYEDALGHGQSLTGARSDMAHDTEAVNDINAIYQQYLFRPADAAGLAGKETELAAGETLDQVRSEVANSLEAYSKSPGVVAAIESDYEQILGRRAYDDPVSLAGKQYEISLGETLDQVRSEIAHSAEATQDIRNAFSSLLDRPASDTDIAYWESHLQDGSVTLDGMRQQLTAATIATIQNDYQQILGRRAEPADLAAGLAEVAAGTSLDQVRSEIAHSNEAASDIGAIYWQYLFRPADAAGLAGKETELADGETLDQVRSEVANSLEAYSKSPGVVAAIQNDYQQILGRQADPVLDLAGKQYEISQGEALDQIRNEIAHSSEATQDIRNAFSSLLGRSASDIDIAYWESHLQDGSVTLDGMRQQLAAAASTPGASGLVLQLAEDAWRGDAQFTVSIDGQQVGGVYTATASHGAGQSQSVAINAQLSAGTHTVQVSFINDDYGGTPDTDRNLYLLGATFNGTTISGSSGTLMSNGNVSFNVTVSGTNPSSSDYPPDVIAAARVDFDAAYYLAQNPDVAASGIDPYLHYCTWGWKEGLNPSALFNTNYYLQNNPDVAAAGVNPLAHYHQFGWKEGLNPSAAFSTSAYLAAYPDVAAAGIDPLEHYMLFGAVDGRTIFQVGASTTTSVHNVTLFVAEDAWQGDAQFTVRVDGFQIGGTRTANASYAAGGQQAVSFDVSLPPGSHVIQVAFTNDAWGGTNETDRNLYLLNATLDGQDIPGTRATFMSNGTFNFGVTTGDSAIPAIQAVYQSILGRAATSDELASDQAWFNNGATLANLRMSLANSAEATTQLKAVYSDVLWRPADPGGLSTYTTLLASGWSLADVRRTLAHSNEAEQNLQGLFSTHLGRAASSDEILGFEMALSRNDNGDARFLVSSNVGTIASADARTLLAELGSYVTLSGGLTPTLTAPDGEVLNFRDSTYLAGFALGLCVQAGQAGQAAWDTYGPTVSWLADIGQGYIQEAWKLQEAAKEYAASGYVTDAYLQSLGAQLAMQIQAMPPDQRHNLVLQVPLGATAAEITVTGDPSGGGGLARFSFRLYDPDPGRTALIADAQAYEASAEAAQAAGNQLLAFLDQCQARVDAAYAQLPANARTDKMLGVAQQFVSAAFDAAGRGNWNLVQTLEVAADVSLRLAALPPDQRTTPMTERFIHEQVKHDITVDPTSADPFATFSDHSKGPDLVGTIIEQVVGVVLNVLAFVPGVNVVAAPAAVAWDTAHAAQSFVNGDVLGGVLNLASAIGVGLVNVGAIGQALGLSAQDVENLAASTLGTAASNVGALAANTLGNATGELVQVGKVVLDGTALVGGLSGIAQNAANGDGLGIAAGILQTAAAVASGLVDTGELKEVIPQGASADTAAAIAARNAAVQNFANRIAIGAGLASVGASSADAFARGDLAGGLLISLSALLGKLTQQITQDGGIEAWFGASNDSGAVRVSSISVDGNVEVAADPRQVLTNLAIHTQAVDDLASQLRNYGVFVTREVTFRDPTTGLGARADVVLTTGFAPPSTDDISAIARLTNTVPEAILTSIASRPPNTPFMVIEVKTGLGDYSYNQNVIYPMVRAGQVVLPVGDNALLAGFDLGRTVIPIPVIKVNK